MAFANPISRILVGIAGSMLSLWLCSCSEQPPAPPPAKVKHVRHVPAQVTPPPQEIVLYGPNAYLLHLTLADLTLQASAPEIPVPDPDYEIARAYSQQVQSGIILQPALILEYTVKDSHEHKHVAIPFSMPHEDDGFPGLAEAMDRLNNLSYTMYDLRLAVISLPPSEPMLEETTDNAIAQSHITNRLEPLIRKAAPMPAMLQSRLGLELTRFFMLHKYKEAAYIAIENAKHSLATVSISSPESDVAIQNLFGEIDAQEKLLYKTMPFTFDF